MSGEGKNHSSRNNSFEERIRQMTEAAENGTKKPPTWRERKVRMSVSDLLHQRESYSHLFSLIDKSSYQKKAPLSIYSTDELPSSEEIQFHIEGKQNNSSEYIKYPANYGHTRRSSSRDGATRPLRKSSLPSLPMDPRMSSASVLSCISTQTSMTEAEYIFDLDNTLLIRTRTWAKDASRSQMVFLRRSKSLYVLESGLANAQPVPPPRPLRPNSIWRGCILEYKVIPRHLNVRLMYTEDGPDDGLDGKLVAKVFLLPDRLQKQTIAVKRTDSKSHKRVCFKKLTGPQIQVLAIGVELSLSIGLFKRPQSLCRWCFPLNKVNLIGEHTVWQRFDRVI